MVVLQFVLVEDGAVRVHGSMKKTRDQTNFEY